MVPCSKAPCAPVFGFSVCSCFRPARTTPGETYRLLQPSEPRDGGPTGVDVTLWSDLRTSPRVFVHWAKDISGEHLGRGASLMKGLRIPPGHRSAAR
jgi:hypothetical protein